MSITFGGGNIGIIIEKTAGTVHTTNIYVVPIWLILAILAVTPNLGGPPPSRFELNL